MTLSRSLSRVAICAIAMAFFAVTSADAQTIIINDSFADGITNNGPDQLGFNVTSSNAALDVDQAPGPVDFATGDSGRTIHSLFPAQTLEELGDVLEVTFDFTTPTTLTFDGGTNGVTGSGTLSLEEDFKFGLFDTSGTVGLIDSNTMLPIDFTGPINSSGGTPNTALNGLAGIQCEIDNINAPGTDLGVRTHNVNSNLNEDFPSGNFLGTNSGFEFIAGGDDDIVSLLPNSDYTGSIRIAYTDATLDVLEITVGMTGTGVNGAFNDVFVVNVAIADVPGAMGSVGVNTNTFDLIAFNATTGAFGGTVGPTVGSSTVGEDNNGIDISNVTITFTDASDLGACMLGDVNMDGVVDFFDIQPFIDLLANQAFQCEGDIDGNMMVDFFDIQPFINILAGI